MKNRKTCSLGISGILAVLAFAALQSNAHAQSNENTGRPLDITVSAHQLNDVSTDPPTNDYPDTPGGPVGENPKAPPDDTYFYLLPASSYEAGVGLSQYGDGAGHLGMTGNVIMLLSAARLNVLVDAGFATKADGIGTMDGVTKAQIRFPIDGGHTIWAGGGVDLQGRYSSVSEVNGFSKAQLIGVAGTMFRVGDTDQCIINFFGKAGYGYDNDINTAPGTKADVSGWRPVVGAEMFTQCGEFRFIGDAQHLFTASGFGDTDKISLQFSWTTLVNFLKANAGFFIKGELIHYGANTSPLSKADVRYVPRLSVGMQIKLRN